MTTIVYALALLLGLGQAGSPQAAQRFDYTVVRADFFAGLAGDEARFLKAMEACEKVLAEDPRHAEALVWHGSGLLFQSGRAFMSGDSAKGRGLWDRGITEMNEAVSLAPDNVGVLIPRGATLLQASRDVPGPAARPLIEQGVKDYEKVLALQAAYFNTLGDHPRGELLFGLADGYHRLGQPETARTYFERVVSEAPTSGQAPRADAWLKTGTVPAAKGLGCVGCHK